MVTGRRWVGNRRWRRFVAVGCALATLAGCGGVPSSSPPRAVKTDAGGTSGREQEVRPEPGASPRDVVDSFLQAASNPEGNHRVARLFLTPSAADLWQDLAGATVLGRSPYLAEESQGSAVALRGDVSATVGTDGAYRAANGAFNYRFRMAKVNGQWRIDNPPPGLVVDPTGFAQFFRRVNVYFLDPTERFVVPDPRWFAIEESRLPDRVLKALVDGQSAALQGAVKTELTGGNATLRTGDGTAADGVARVSLTGIGDLNKQARAGLAAQLVWTLDQVGLAEIEIDDEGQPLLQGGTDPIQRLGDWRSFDSLSLGALTPGYFVDKGSIQTTDGQQVGGPSWRIGLSLSSVAVSRDRLWVAAVGRTERNAVLYVGRAQDAPQQRLKATTLSTPTWGGAVDEVWAVRDGSVVVRVPRGRGQPTQVGAPVLDRLGPVRALRLSRDGCRVAVVAGPAGRAGLYVGNVSRGDGVVSIDDLHLVEPSLTNVVDVSWWSADALYVVAGSGSGSDVNLSKVGVDGATEQLLTLGGLPGPLTQVAAARDLPTLATAEGGGIWALGDSWTAVRRGTPSSPLTGPAYPG